VQAYADPGPSACDQAFERLYRRYARDVYRYTLAVLRNPADAEDVTQTTFLNAYRAMQQGEEPVKPQNWLIKIAHNACRTRHLRAARRVQEVPLEENLAEHLAVPSDELPNVTEVLEALGTLPFNQRAALVMRELEGRNYAEIAETLDVSVSAVETLLFRARRGMRDRTKALRALGFVQLPASLSSFTGGGAAAGSGALLGSGLLVKAVAVLAAGIVAGGVGYKTVKATVLKPQAPKLSAIHEPERLGVFAATSAPKARVSSSEAASDAPSRAAVRRKVTSDEQGKGSAAGQSGSPAAAAGNGNGTAVPGGSSGSPSTGDSSSAPQPGRGTTPTETVKKALPPVPDVPEPQLPPLPIPPVATPPIPAPPIGTPPLPVPPVTPPVVPLPQAPLPPPPPPVPKIP
jgi:RNA polymerase sigma factor (sigma-70 family)